ATWSNTLPKDTAAPDDLCNELCASRQGTVYAATYNGLYTSPDHGGNWRRITQVEGTADGVAAGNDGAVYAHSQSKVTYRSADDGITWSELPGDMRVTAVCPNGRFFSVND